MAVARAVAVAVVGVERALVDAAEPTVVAMAVDSAATVPTEMVAARMAVRGGTEERVGSEGGSGGEAAVKGAAAVGCSPTAGPDRPSQLCREEGCHIGRSSGLVDP